MDEMLKARQHMADLIAPPAQRRATFRFNFTTQRGG
jgi:hypothetical protein